MTTSELRPPTAPPSARHLLSKVPEVTVYFWIIKVLTTGMGEAAADFLSHRLAPVIAVGLAGTGLAASVLLQFAVRRYVAWIYWLAVVMVSVFGTLTADGLRVGLGLSHLVNTVVFVLGLVVVFAAWYAAERTLSIHSIHTRSREAFYWATVMTTFALGTAVGDWTAMSLGWGFLASGVIFTVAITLPWIAHRRFGANAIWTFWVAYVLTRPVGASFADWMAVPKARGGLDWGTGTVTVAMSIVIAALVGYLTLTRTDVDSGTED